MKSHVTAIVAAGGTGRRLKNRLHKSFVPLRGKPLLAWTLWGLQRSPAIHEIILVVHRLDLKKAKNLVGQYRFRKVSRIVPGGRTRTESVFQGLKALSPQTEIVAIHDGARPLAITRLFHQTIQAARSFGAAIAAIPVVPTVKQASSRWVFKTLNRNHLWAVQTPQAFRREWIEQAHEKARAKGVAATDDAALVEALGHRVRIVMGDPRNIKVTTPEDLLVAEALMRKRRVS